jgi:hypothetical protein
MVNAVSADEMFLPMLKPSPEASTICSKVAMPLFVVRIEVFLGKGELTFLECNHGWQEYSDPLKAVLDKQCKGGELHTARTTLIA